MNQPTKKIIQSDGLFGTVGTGRWCDTQGTLTETSPIIVDVCEKHKCMERRQKFYELHVNLANNLTHVLHAG